MPESRSNIREILAEFEKEIPRLYPESRDDYRNRKVTPASVKDYLRQEKERFIEIAKLLPEVRAGGSNRLLDVGIAYGFLPVLIKEISEWKCEGLELQENIDIYCAFARERGIPVHSGTLGMKPLPFKDGSFGAVIFSEVLEHLRISPDLALTELRRILSPGGCLVLTTPNFARLTNIVKLIIGRNPLEPFPEHQHSENITDQLTHIREYTMEELEILARRTGFTILAKRFSACMESQRPHSVFTRLLPRYRGNLMLLLQK
jgi:SAM-dependent methyltransferase